MCPYCANRYRHARNFNFISIKEIQQCAKQIRQLRQVKFNMLIAFRYQFNVWTFLPAFPTKMLIFSRQFSLAQRNQLQ